MICKFCKREIRLSVTFFFIECPLVKELRHAIEEWLNEKLGRNVGFNRDSILFGKFEKKNIDKIENRYLIILLVKQYIDTSTF